MRDVKSSGTETNRQSEPLEQRAAEPSERSPTSKEAEKPLDPTRLFGSEDLRPPPHLAGNIRTAIADAPSREAPIRRRLLFAAFAVPIVVTIVTSLRATLSDRSVVRCDIGDLSLREYVPRLVLVLVLAVVASGVALLPGRRGFGAPGRILLIAALAVAPIYALVTLLPMHSPADEAAASIAFHSWALPCILVAAAVGTLTLVAFGLALRRSVPVSSSERGAALGATAGAWAGAGLFIHCPARDMTHLFIGHVLPVAVFAVLGALFVPRALRP